MLKQQFFPLVSGSGPSIIASSGNGRGRQKETPISTVRWKGSHLPAGLDGKASRTTFLPSCYQRISSLDQRIWEGRSYNFFLLSLGRCSLFHAAVIILPLSLIPPPPPPPTFTCKPSFHCRVRTREILFLTSNRLAHFRVLPESFFSPFQEKSNKKGVPAGVGERGEYHPNVFLPFIYPLLDKTASSSLSAK